MTKNTISVLALSGALFGVFAAGCTSSTETQHQDLGQQISDTVGCQNFRSQVFDAFYMYVNKNKSGPSSQLVEKFSTAALSKRLSQLAIPDTDKQKIISTTQNIIKTLSQTTDEVTTLEKTRWLIQLETGSVATEEIKSQGNYLEQQTQQLNQLVQKYSVACANPDPAREPASAGPSGPEVNPQVGSIPRMALAARFAFANAYQSCDVLNLPDMTLSTETLQGVAKDKSVDGIGWGRKYTDISLLQKTDYYIHGFVQKPNCLAVSEKPLVYDYGGVPAWDGADSLNFFANSGPGGPALGVDCSAYVSSAIAQAGFRYRPGLPNKPIYTRRSSGEFLNPEAYGLSCFDRISLSLEENLRVGDIMAIQGHVVMIDRVGADPFGILKVPTASQCSNITYKDFDFTIIQSSPSKNSIGINRYIAKDYLSESSSQMRLGFEKYAKAACLSHFDKKTRKLKESDVAIIRHKETAECLAPNRVQLVGQECVQSCSYLRQDE